jgi:hypothetical protein
LIKNRPTRHEIFLTGDVCLETGIRLFLKMPGEKSISQATRIKNPPHRCRCGGFYLNVQVRYAPLASFNVKCFVSGAQAIDTIIPINRTAASTIMVA